jgi:PucR C-terminal helix-turn-helix domain
MKTASAGGPPWAGLPADLGQRLRPALPSVVTEVIDTIAREVPSYSRPLEGAFGAAVRRGVEVALSRFLDLPGSTQPALQPAERTVYLALGRGELRQGRTLEVLLAAYRVGARVAFRRFAGLARELGLDPEALVTLAEATFAYIDELSAASVEGLAIEQSHRAGERDRLRAKLLELLVSGSGDDTALAELAAAAEWPLPDVVVPIVVAPEHAYGLALRVGAGALVALSAESVVALVPAPATEPELQTLRRQLRGRGCVISLPGSCRDIGASVRLGALALRVLHPLETDAGRASQPVVVAERLVDLVLRRDPTLAAALAQRELAPLATLREGARQRLTETLLAWLSYRGERNRVAAVLHIHPQTVAYRLTTLRELFGEALADPDRRFALELALRATSDPPSTL